MRAKVVLIGIVLSLLLASPASADFAGQQLQPADIAALDAHTWGGIGLVKAVAVALAESHGYVGAWHDNANGTRDCGLYQIDIPASEIGTELERQLRTDSLDPDFFIAAASYNVDRAKALYDHPWTRHGKATIREWQPWVAYTTGWPTFPGWWVWHQASGVPVGPWIATGRYIQQAIVGVANYRIKNGLDVRTALALARHYASIFHVQGQLGISIKPGPWIGLVYWRSIPAKPAAAPADGVGPRPVPNDGH